MSQDETIHFIEDLESRENTQMILDPSAVTTMAGSECPEKPWGCL